MMMPVRIWMAALENQTGPSGRQCSVWAVRFRVQKSLMGMQKAKPLITIHKPKMMRLAIVMYVAIRKVRQ